MSTDMDKTNHLPLYVQVREYILQRIASEQYPAGSQIPTEKELMEKLGVGRVTVRTALSELEREGYIVKKHGIGTFVADSNRELGFEPLISLTYSLDKMGIRSENRFVRDEQLTVRDGLLREGWETGTQVIHLERIRCAEGFPIAVENSYFLPALYERIRSADPNASVAHALLSQKDIHLEKMEHRILFRKPTMEERASLTVAQGDRVIELTRWLYCTGSSQPMNFVKFVIPETMMLYPFSVFNRKGKEH